jgi:TRAP-type C4-dicarboxylate transport system permease small subunit
MADEGAPASSGDGGHGTPSPLLRSPLGRVAEGVTALAGIVLVLMALLVVASVTGRYLFDAPITGDYEIVETAGAVAIFLCFPYTHLTGSNIVAEFFTTALSDRWKLVLDTVHDLIFALVAALFTWRLALGCIHKYNTNDTTALLAIPIWMAFTVAVLAMALLCVVCIARFVAGLGQFRR